jgi:hypothetical protein
VLTTAGMAVQAPVSGEAALVGGTHPMTAGVLAMRVIVRVTGRELTSTGNGNQLG